MRIPALSRPNELRAPEGGAGEGSPAAEEDAEAAAASLGAKDASAAAGASFEAEDAAAAGEMVEKGAAEVLSVRARRDLAMRDMARRARGVRNVGGFVWLWFGSRRGFKERVAPEPEKGGEGGRRRRRGDGRRRWKSRGLGD